MGAGGITLLMVALLFGWEALVHFRKVGAAGSTSTASGSSASGSSGATGSTPSASGTPTTAPSSQPGTGSSSQPGYQQATQADIAYLIQRAQAAGIDPNAYLALVAWESDNFNVHAIGDNGKSLGLHQLYTVVWPIPRDCGLDAKCNTDFWWSNFGPTAQRLYNALGGTPAFQANPSAFLQRWVPAVQGSDPWNNSIAQTALQRVAAIRSKYGV